MKKENIVTEMNVNNNKVGIMRVNNTNYISITDLVKFANADDPSGVIRNWMSNQNSFAFYSLWEEINNPSFNSVESHGIKTNEVPYNRFYLIHTDAIKNYIVPELSEQQKKFVYAEEADVLNVALFGMTAKEWRTKNPELAREGNVRDFTDILHLIILNNLENINAELIEMGISQQNRLVQLNRSAKKQIELLQYNENIKQLGELSDK